MQTKASRVTTLEPSFTVMFAKSKTTIYYVVRIEQKHDRIENKLFSYVTTTLMTKDGIGN